MKSLIVAMLLSLTALTVRAADDGPLVGIDHIPLAVGDLDTAAASYRALGFALKPGQLPDDSITNVHAKYPDGTEIELITASQPKDALATTYLKSIAAGEGPASRCIVATSRNCPRVSVRAASAFNEATSSR